MAVKEFKITLSKTVQVQQYEPLTVTLTETHEFDVNDSDSQPSGKWKVQATDKLTAVLVKAVDRALDRYRE